MFLLERDGRLAALDLHHGGRLWEQGLDAGEERLTAHGFSVSGDRIFLRTPRRVAALEACSGRVLWETPFRHEDWMGPCGCPLVVGERVFVPAMRGNGLSAFDAATGALLWQTGAEEPGLERIVGGLTHSRKHDYLFLPGFHVEDSGASDDRGTVGRLYALESRRGTKVWERSVGSYNYTTPVVAGNTLLVSDMIEGRLLALDAASGQDLWSLQTGAPLQCLAPRRREGPGVSSSPAVGGEVVYLGASDGCLYAVDSASGAVLSRTNLGAAVASSPALYGRAVFITCRDDFVVCVSG